MSRTAYLILENGVVFEGKSFGAEKETMGELVFTTSMVGYLETLTDPSYYGQVVMQTFPLIGNYGVIHPEFISDAPVLNGYIVREWCQVPSNFRCEGDLDTFLKESNIPGIYGIDTRALTKIIREKILLNTQDEIPHSVAITIDKYQEAEDIDRIYATIYCEQKSQKGILIGKGGSLLKKIGTEARLELEEITEKKVFLALEVKVEKDWRKKDKILKNFGYVSEKD